MLMVGAGPITAAVSAAPRDRWAALATPTRLTDSGRKIVGSLSAGAAQPSQGGSHKAVKWVIGFTVFPLTGALFGMITGAMGALVTGRTLSDGFLTGSVVVGTALGVAAGTRLCVK